MLSVLAQVGRDGREGMEVEGRCAGAFRRVGVCMAQPCHALRPHLQRRKPLTCPGGVVLLFLTLNSERGQKEDMYPASPLPTTSPSTQRPPPPAALHLHPCRPQVPGRDQPHRHPHRAPQWHEDVCLLSWPALGKPALQQHAQRRLRCRLPSSSCQAACLQLRAAGLGRGTPSQLEAGASAVAGSMPQHMTGPCRPTLDMTSVHQAPPSQPPSPSREAAACL